MTSRPALDLGTLAQILRRQRVRRQALITHGRPEAPDAGDETGWDTTVLSDIDWLTQHLDHQSAEIRRLTAAMQAAAPRLERLHQLERFVEDHSAAFAALFRLEQLALGRSASTPPTPIPAPQEAPAA
jgi:hypothetical protein